MKTAKHTDDLCAASKKRMFSGIKSLLITGLLASLLPWAVGCSALDPHRICEKELADTRAQLEQTSQLANKLTSQVRAQRAELQDLKEHSVEDVRRQEAQALAQIEVKRQELEQERFEIDRMREIQQAELEK